MKKILHTKYGIARLNNKNGYFQIGNGKNNHKYLHRLIFEDFYNFEIPKGFVVHHKDGNKQNNCILNLQLLSEKEHSRLHNKGKILSEETKQKIKESKIGKKRKPFSDEWKKNMSKCRLGEKNSRFLNHLPNDEELYSENKRGMTIQDLALKYNCGTSTIQRRMSRYKKQIKDKPQLITSGKNKDGKIMYGIRWNGEVIKYSVYKNKLIEWFEKTYGEKVVIF